MRELKISASGIRGVVGEALTPELIADFACAFGTWVLGDPMVVGRDTRPSSVMLRAAVLSGLFHSGCEVIDMGISPTPLVSFAVRELGAAGGIAITGSHNGPEWNALKFLGPDGMALDAAKSEELLDIYHARAFEAAPGGNPAKPLDAAPGVLKRYVDHLLASCDGEAVRKAGFRVVVDFCNGACGEVVVRLLERLGCGLVPLNEEPRRSFAHDPAPVPANMGPLAAAVHGAGADLGAALNIDGDRIAFVTAEGIPLTEEHTLPISAMSRLERRPGPVVTNLSTSRMIDAAAGLFGQRVIRTAVGEGHVVSRAVEEGAVLAGEGSGGVASLPASMAFDGLATLSLVLEAMALEKASLAELAAGLPPFAMRKGAVPAPPAKAYRVLEAFRARRPEPAPDVTDGLRYEWDDAWLHVRASATEPILRVIAEAETGARADALFAEAMEAVAAAVEGESEGT